MGRGGGREESELLARALAATPGIHRTGKLQSHQPGASGSLSLTWIKVAYCPPRLPNSLPPTFSWFTKKDEKLEGEEGGTRKVSGTVWSLGVARLGTRVKGMSAERMSGM